MDQTSAAGAGHSEVPGTSILACGDVRTTIGDPSVRVDLHVHTVYSPDCLTALAAVPVWAQRRGLDAVAITDHDAIAGALALQQMTDFPVIVGEEVHTRQGEIIGLFIREAIPPGLSARDAAERIHEQGGIVYLPHPFDSLRGSAMAAGALPELVDVIDVVEGLNARVMRAADNAQAMAWAKQHGLAVGAGSDAHHVREIGQAYVEMPPFTGAGEFLEALHSAHIGGGRSSSWVHLYSTWARLSKRLLGASPCRSASPSEE
jgi:predicted metal-dependent phosphoesterase TrpH